MSWNFHPWVSKLVMYFPYHSKHVIIIIIIIIIITIIYLVMQV